MRLNNFVVNTVTFKLETFRCQNSKYSCKVLAVSVKNGTQFFITIKHRCAKEGLDEG